MSHPGVSFVICCYNSARRLKPVLEALLRQTTSQPWEVLLIDNNCTDDTVAVARELWPATAAAPLRVIVETKVGQFYARIRGANEASYDYICFVDDDNIITPGWVETISEIFARHAEVGVIGACSEALVPEGTPEWFFWHDSAYAIGPQAPVEGGLPPGQWVYGAGVSIRRTAWKNLFAAGFTPLLSGRQEGRPSSGDDAELVLCLQLSGWVVYYCPRLQLQHAIAPHRIRYELLEKLVEAFGQADVYLSIYRAFLLSRKQGWRNRLKAWLLLSPGAQTAYRYAKIFAFKSVRLFAEGRKKSNYNLVCWRSRGYLGELNNSRGRLKVIQAERFAWLENLTKNLL